MAVAVWLATGLALSLLILAVPNGAKASVVGRLLGGLTGSAATGLAGQLLLRDGLNDVGIQTILLAIPGTLLGIWLAVAIQRRNGPDPTLSAEGPLAHTGTPPSTNGHDPDLRLIRD